MANMNVLILTIYVVVLGTFIFKYSPWNLEVPLVQESQESRSIYADDYTAKCTSK